MSVAETRFCGYCGSGNFRKDGDAPEYCVDCGTLWMGLIADTRARDPAVAVLEAEVKRLRAGLAMISANEYPAAGMVNGKCRHDRYSYESCEECVWDFALSILNPAPSEKEAG